MDGVKLVLFMVLILTSAVFAKEKNKHIREKNRKLELRESSQSLLVTTENGVVEGVQNVTVDTEGVYYAFHGIPYAQPPIGTLRFAPPLPAQNWTGIYDATYERSICVQNSDLITVVGSENCLYINVYTTQVPASNYSTLLPVMVWIYGGGFLNGNGNYASYGPDFLLDENVLVVTFNYRLGIFGFLSTEDSVVSGNSGLKDQVLALKWVRNNIGAFGGDPNNVTIFGESAGAASVTYLIQSNLTKGLYRRAIIESGTSLCLWALSRTARSAAFYTGRRLLIFTDDSSRLVGQLRNVNYKRLQTASLVSVGTILLTTNPLDGLVFAPVIEPDVEGAVLTNRSYELLQNGDFNQVPLLLGFNSEEGNGFSNVISLLKFYLLTYDLSPERLVPVDMNINSSNVRTDVGQLIRVHYVGAEGILLLSEMGFIHFLSDDEFVRPTRQFVRLTSKRVGVYFYQFSYEGALGNTNRGTEKGVGHAEELNYLFRTNFDNVASSSDLRTRYRLVRLWTNFAKYGNPTPVRDPLLQNVTWPVANTTANLTYLDIGVNLKVQSDPHAYDMNFWDYLYESYSNSPYDTY